MKRCNILSLWLLILGGCIDIDDNGPNADFDFHIVGSCNDGIMAVQFENKALDATSFKWSFGDGTSSNEVTPAKVYQKAGVYKVSLVAFDEEREFDVVTKEIFMRRNNDGTGPVIQPFEITFDPQNRMRFTLKMKIENSVNHVVDFGDGSAPILTISSLEEFEYRYAYPGYSCYIVMVTATGPEGTNCRQLLLDF